jgi:Ca2+-transporting ATPase
MAVIWYTLETEDTLQRLNVSAAQGLTDEEAGARQAEYGFNELVEQRGRGPLSILWEQITNPLVLLLIGAAFVSALLGKTDSVIAISAIVILNALLGLGQEYRTEKAMAALKRMAAPLVRARRNGQVVDIAARELVPGDVVLLDVGSIVPADSRVIEAANLRVQEASLTGESEPVDKTPQVLGEANMPLGDRHNMLYMGTAVTYGRGTAVVVETGMKTELGRIAKLMQAVHGEKTPLQRRMDELGSVLIKAALVVMALAFVVGLITGHDREDVLLNAVAIAVAVVPEGLPAVVTIALALGAQRMLKRQALIRKLPAVETLGSVTTICSDKTGTLTENRMTVKVVDIAGTSILIEESLDCGKPTTRRNGREIPPAQMLTLVGGALCNDAIFECKEDQFRALGDPTEGALVVAAAKFGLLKPDLDLQMPRIAESPFDSDRKRMTTIHRIEPDADQEIVRRLGSSPLIAFTKGSVDGLLDISDCVWDDGKIVPLDATFRQRIEAANAQMAQDGLRVLGVAFRPFDQLPETISPDMLESNLTFVGLIGIIDPPRTEVKDAIRRAISAGIRPVMITGDHPLTAYAIARELGIANETSRVLTGQDLSRMSLEELEAQVEQVAVFARVSPEHKLQIVQALQNRGQLVAMTGDGVNDAPALKRSDIGVAMGITGTAVSKEASDMVILDDNFATIVSAVEEGRGIYDNVRRFVKYLLASNTGELFVLLVSQLISGMTIPLTTLQILWMNLITDGFPALALGVENAEKGVMKRAPYAPNESLFGRGMSRHILLMGLLMGVTGIGLGYWAFETDQRATNGAVAWNTMVFIFLALAQMGHALGLRSHRESLFSLNFFSNRLLIGAVGLTIILQMVAVYTPFFNDLFNTHPLTLGQLVICLGLSTVVFWGVELEKLAIRRGWLKA